MMKQEYQKAIEDCYIAYCEVIKPLIAVIEAQSETLPLPVFNELRAFNDHIARCYFRNPDDNFISGQIDKAQRHIVRVSLDCFKCLNVIYFRKVELFERQTRNIDLTVIDNGVFFPEYSRMKQEAAELVNKAKLAEAYDTEESLRYFEKSYNLYSELATLMESVSEKVRWAKVRFTTRKIVTIVAWILSVVISALVSSFFSCEIVSSIFGF